MEVYLIAAPRIDRGELQRFLGDIGAFEWKSTADNDVQQLIEVGGRLCYNSFVPGLNKNVQKVRTSSDKYIKNIIRQQHGSVLEHAQLTFIFKDVSLICLAELCRHRVGIAISQQSGRYVVPDMDMFPNPGFSEYDWQEILSKSFSIYYSTLYQDGGDYDALPFARKKELTSLARRALPQGMLSRIQWSANIRALRHIIQLRTTEHAEVEIRELFNKVYDIVVDQYPVLFEDLKDV